MTGEGSRRPRDMHGRLVIDLRTPPGTLSRSDLRRLREELELEVMAHEPRDDEPAPDPAAWHGDDAGAVTGRHRTADLRRPDEHPPDAYPSDRYPSDHYPSDSYPPRSDGREAYPWPGSRARSPLLPPRRARDPEPEPVRSPSPMRSPRTGRAMEPPSWAETHGRRPDTGGWSPSRPGLPNAGLDDLRDDFDDDLDPEPTWSARDSGWPGPRHDPDRADPGGSWPGPEPEAPWWDDDEGFPPPARSPQPVTMRFAEDAGLHELRRGTARPAGRGARVPDPQDRVPDPQDRAPARSSGRVAPRGERSRLRPALLIRATVVIGLLAALAASIDRADRHPSSGNVDVARGTAGELQAGGTSVGAGAVLASNKPTAAMSTAPVMPSAPPGTVTALPVTTTGDGGGQSGALPAAPCHISYSVTLGTGDQFTVVMVIANTSNTKVNGWTLRWQYPPAQKILYGWNAMVAVAATGAAATGIGVDQAIAPGGSVTIGFVGQRGAWVPTPTGFALNGQTCQWQPTVASMTPDP